MKHIAKLLVETNIVHTNFVTPFIWTSGIESPIYCDCRELISLPEARNTIIEAFLLQLENLEYDYIVGPATAGIPWAAILADRLKIPMLYVRSKPKGHGAGKMVEGRVDAALQKSLGDKPKMVVVEDAFSTGGSSIKSAQALRDEAEAQVDEILGIFSWDTPQAKTNASVAQVKLSPLTEFDEIVEALVAADKISATEKSSLMDFKSNPAQWGTARNK